jgi:hypothetical protein
VWAPLTCSKTVFLESFHRFIVFGIKNIKIAQQNHVGRGVSFNIVFFLCRRFLGAVRQEFRGVSDFFDTSRIFRFAGSVIDMYRTDLKFRPPSSESAHKWRPRYLPDRLFLLGWKHNLAREAVKPHRPDQ